MGTEAVDAWETFFAASAGAAAGLTGLIIVAMSVNIGTIIAIPGMTSRAGSTIASLVLVVVVSMAGLIPGQPLAMFGVEVLVFGLAGTGFAVDSVARIFMTRGDRPWWSVLLKAVVVLVQVLPFLVAGGMLLAGDASGIGWIAAGILAVFVGSVLGAWVLLVEILR